MNVGDLVLEAPARRPGRVAAGDDTGATGTLQDPAGDAATRVRGTARGGLLMDVAVEQTSSRPWHRKTTVIAALSVAAILAHLALRFGFRATPTTSEIPLLITLAIGGAPLLYDLLRKLLKREFGSDLLGGIAIITSVLLGEYLAGSIIVLMLAGGEALE